MNRYKTKIILAFALIRGTKGYPHREFRTNTILRSISNLILVLLFLSIITGERGYCSSPSEDPSSKAIELMQMIATAPPDTCDDSEKALLNTDGTELAVDGVEVAILTEASKAVLVALNAGGQDPGVARSQANEILRKLEGSSREINAKWPNENRFHFQLLDLSSALVLKAGIGSHEGFFVFGLPSKVDSFRPDQFWELVGEQELPMDGIPSFSSLEIHLLHSGPSGNPRFLAQIKYSGCAGSSGLFYDAREWNPRERGALSQIIKQEGSVGMDESFTGGKPTRKEPFLPIGKLETKGTFLALPYCWFSAIDTWDNPSLCALDTYDSSGDSVRFKSRAYNRPDLLPVAKVIEYAKKHDYPAVLAYCGNADVASGLMRSITPSYHADDLRVTKKAAGSEHVEVGTPGADGFEVQKRGDRWIVVRFTPSPN